MIFTHHAQEQGISPCTVDGLLFTVPQTQHKAKRRASNSLKKVKKSLERYLSSFVLYGVEKNKKPYRVHPRR
jgi:hypothetical protein